MRAHAAENGTARPLPVFCDRRLHFHPAHGNGTNGFDGVLDQHPVFPS